MATVNYNEILKDYVGDVVEFLNYDGTWNNKVLRKDGKHGLHVMHRGYKVPVEHWGKGAVCGRVKPVKNAPCTKVK